MHLSPDNHMSGCPAGPGGGRKAQTALLEFSLVSPTPDVWASSAEAAEPLSHDPQDARAGERRSCVETPRGQQTDPSGAECVTGARPTHPTNGAKYGLGGRHRDPRLVSAAVSAHALPPKPQSSRQTRGRPSLVLDHLMSPHFLFVAMFSQGVFDCNERNPIKLTKAKKQNEKGLIGSCN